MLVVFAFGLPMPMFLAAMLWAVGDIIGIFIPSGTANIAHLSGLAFGLFIGAFLRQPAYRQTQQERSTVNEEKIRAWEDRYLR